MSLAKTTRPLRSVTAALIATSSVANPGDGLKHGIIMNVPSIHAAGLAMLLMKKKGKTSTLNRHTHTHTSSSSCFVASSSLSTIFFVRTLACKGMVAPQVETQARCLDELRSGPVRPAVLMTAGQPHAIGPRMSISAQCLPSSCPQLGISTLGARTSHLESQRHGVFISISKHAARAVWLLQGRRLSGRLEVQTTATPILEIPGPRPRIRQLTRTHGEDSALPVDLLGTSGNTAGGAYPWLSEKMLGTILNSVNSEDMLNGLSRTWLRFGTVS